MMFGEYEIIKYKPCYKEQVVELQTQLWGPDLDNNRAYFEWKYEANPFVGEVPALLALHNGRVVAFRGFFPQRWVEENEAVMNAFSPADLVVDEAHRRRGLFKAMTKASFEIYKDSDVQFFVNLSSNEKSSPGYLKFGWKPLVKRSCLVRHSWRGNVLRLIRYAGNLGMIKPIFSAVVKRCKGEKESGEGVSKANTDATSGAREDTASDYREYQVIDSAEYKFKEVDQLCAKLSKGRIAHVHSQEYMKWRFQSPRHNYQFIYLYKENVLCGYLILARLLAGNRRSGHVVDYGVTDEKSFRKLINVMLKKYKFNVLQWTVYGEALTFSPLSKAGFKAKQQLSVLIRPKGRVLSEAAWIYGGADTMDEGRWRIRGIYSDGV